MDKTGISSKDSLMLDYLSFNKLCKEKRNLLSSDVYAWLVSWEMLDLSLSPMDDEKRKLLRYGHYLGWFDRDKEDDFS